MGVFEGIFGLQETSILLWLKNLIHCQWDLQGPKLNFLFCMYAIGPFKYMPAILSLVTLFFVCLDNTLP
jgi:hypothetical protein